MKDLKAPRPQLKPLVRESYLAAIRNAIGSRMFRNYYVEIDGKTTDIAKDGELSCAIFASAVLTLSGLIKGPHATVTSTVRDLKESGWLPVSEPQTGAVLVWKPSDLGGSEPHGHIGFYMGDDRAISNSTTQGVPVGHHWTYEGSREIAEILWNPALE